MDGKRKDNIANLIYFTGLILMVSVQFLKNTTLTVLDPFYREIMMLAVFLFLIKYFVFQKNNFFNIFFKFFNARSKII